MRSDHPKVNYGKTWILIVNLGTPDSTSWLDIRKYLREFLSDRRVIEVNPILWKIILNLIILTFRPAKTAKAYKKIWLKKENMSPLRYYTIQQTEKLKKSTWKKVFKNLNLLLKKLRSIWVILFLPKVPIKIFQIFILR